MAKKTPKILKYMKVDPTRGWGNGLVGVIGYQGHNGREALLIMPDGTEEVIYTAHLYQDHECLKATLALRQGDHQKRQTEVDKILKR